LLLLRLPQLLLLLLGQHLLKEQLLRELLL